MQLSSDSESFQDAREAPASDRPAGFGASRDGASATALARSPAPGGESARAGGGEVARRADQQAPAPATPPTEAPEAKPRRKGRRRAILLVILAIALSGGGYEGYHWWTVGRFELSTDDAYLGADMSILSAKVSGYVTAVEVEENQPVRQGDVIARIDDGDYRLAVQSARDQIAVQKAAVERIGVQIEAARAGIDEAEANIQSAEATVDLTTGELARKTKLAKTNFASVQDVDTARADHDRALAALAAAKAARTSAEANVSVLEAQQAEASATLGSLRTALKQAERDLSFTVVRAPVDGVVGNKAVEVGELVQPGTRLAAVVPLSSVYVEANFKETQLADMHAGQTAEVTVDAFPDEVFTGKVESISPASGALFSLLPPENATGNFTKIVQRLPVRVKLSPEATEAHALRPGMSVVVTVDTRTGPQGAVAQAVVPAGAGTAMAAEASAADAAASDEAAQRGVTASAPAAAGEASAVAARRASRTH